VTKPHRKIKQAVLLSLVAATLTGCVTEHRELKAEYVRSEPMGNNAEIAVLKTDAGDEVKLFINSRLNRLAVEGTAYCLTYVREYGSYSGYRIYSMIPQTGGDCEW